MGPRKKNFLKKHRGYYSESIIEPAKDDGASQANPDAMLAWKMKTPTLLPVCHDLPFDGGLVHWVHERWVQFGTPLNMIFPATTLEPKVQLEQNVPTGCLPRGVELERCLRKNLLTNIDEELALARIRLAHIIPVHVLQEHLTKAEKGNKFSKTISRLPLEWFDDYEFECRTPEEFMRLGVVDGFQHAIPAKAFLPVANRPWEDDEAVVSRKSIDAQQKRLLPSAVLMNFRANLYHWQMAAVTDYDYQKDRWTTIDLDTKLIYQLPRIYVAFLADNARIFTKRIKHALAHRAKCEAHLKFMFIVDNMVLTDYPELGHRRLTRILNIVASTLKVADAISTESFDKLINEACMSYQKAQCMMEVKQIISASRGAYDEFDCELFRPQPFEKLMNGFYREMSNFQEIRNIYRRNTLLCLGNTIEAMEGVGVECAKVSEMSLFTDFIDKSTLDNFDRVQLKITSHAMDFLKNRFLDSCARSIMLKLYNIGKGWFDMHIGSWELYLISKLSRFVSLVRCRMEVALCNMARRSIDIYCQMLSKPCDCLLEVPSDWRWGRDLRNSPFDPKRVPVFRLELQMNKAGAYYSTKPTKFLPVILRLFDDALHQMHFVPILDPTLLPNLLYPDHLYLSSLGLGHTFVQTNRDLLQLSYHQAEMVLAAYADQYDLHIALFVMDTNVFVQSIEDKNRTSQQIKDEISFQLRMRDNLQVTLPASIIIGPFFINVDPLKQFLINKRRDIADKLLKMLAERLHGKTKSICEQYRQINIRLAEKPRSVEHIHQVREWIETIPEAIRTLEEMMRTTLFEYEILDHFWYAVSNEQFYTKWDAIAWPQKISNQIHATQIAHVEHTDKFQKQQAADVASLGERCEELNAQITGYTLEFDVERVHELAVEMRRLWKSLKELQSFIELLNLRQALFELPEIETDEVQTMMENFRPYHDLWTTGSDSIKAKELWCGNPMSSINTTTIRANLNDHKSKLTDLLDTFAEMQEVLEVNVTFLNGIRECEPLIEIMVALKNPDWTHVHWSELAKRSEMPIKFSESINFQYLLDYGIAKHKELVETISAEATEQKAELEILAREAEEIERQLAIERDRKRQRRLLRTDI